MATNEIKGVQTVTSVKDLEGMKVAGLKELVKTFKTEDEENEILNGLSAKATKVQLVEALAKFMGFEAQSVEEVEPEPVKGTIDNPSEPVDIFELAGIPVEEPNEESDAWVDEQGKIDFFTPMENLAPQEEEVIETEQPESDPFSEDDILAELGLGGDNEIPELDIKTVDEPTADDKPKAGKAKEKKEKKPKKPRVTIPIDAPIPAVSFRGLLIGVYGNVLDELEEQDEQGYLYYERKLERFNQKANESLRATKGRMVIVGTANGSTYLVVAENIVDGVLVKEPVIEVTNKGRGHLRCKQLANILQMAHSDKKDIEFVTLDTYTELKGKITPYVMVTEEPTEEIQPETQTA